VNILISVSTDPAPDSLTDYADARDRVAKDREQAFRDRDTDHPTTSPEYRALKSLFIVLAMATPRIRPGRLGLLI
jgi:hypothetical protein